MKREDYYGMTDIWLHPSLVLLAGALLVPLLKGRARTALLVAVPVLTFLVVVSMEPGNHGVFRFLDWQLTFGRVDRLSRIFGYIMALMCFIGTLYALHVKDPAEHAAAWTYAAGSLGAIFAGDYLTLFLFLGDDGLLVGLPDLAAQAAAIPPCRLPLPAGARGGRC